MKGVCWTLIVRTLSTATSCCTEGDTVWLKIGFVGFEILFKKADNVQDIMSIKRGVLNVDSTHFVHGDISLYSRWRHPNPALPTHSSHRPTSRPTIAPGKPTQPSTVFSSRKTVFVLTVAAVLTGIASHHRSWSLEISVKQIWAKIEHALVLVPESSQVSWSSYIYWGHSPFLR